MVPVINYSEDVSKVLNYNEEKVERGVAELIHAGNFLPPRETLNFYDKLHRFQSLNALNENSDVNTLHVSLNFHPDDQLTDDQLREIAGIYMDRIGMGDQPYLVYKHNDAGHPHIHLVSSLIRPDGTRVRTQNMGKRPSVQARKEIDQIYDLHKVEDSQHKNVYEPDPVNAQKVGYGSRETKKAIKDVLRFVLKKYKFTSIAELNAVLQQYNVLADRGAPGSRVYDNGGLVYRVLDEQGNKEGVPIKASDFYFKPTLVALAEKFEANKPLRKEELPGIRSRIDWTLGKHPQSFQAWQAELGKENIQLVIRRGDQGIIYGLTYVDFKTRTVVNGSDLGKGFSAQAITQHFSRTGKPASNAPALSPAQAKKGSRAVPQKIIAPRARNVPPPTGIPQPKPDNPIPPRSRPPNLPPPPSASEVSGTGGSLLDDLLSEQPGEPIPYELTVDPKKKKKKRRHW